MNKHLKLAAVLCCLLPWIGMLGGSLITKSQHASPVTRDSIALQRRSEKAHGDIAVALLGVGALGAIFLLVDACMRRYETPRGMPIALAVMGLLTFGATSLIYYALWGWHPTYPEKLGRAMNLCRRCLDQCLDADAPGAMSHNFMGTIFIGASERCSVCGSSVKTLWLSLLVPLIPLGSYRILPLESASATTASYVGKKVRLHLPHVLVVFGIELALVVAVTMMTRD
jgi:hypothetical protein